MGSLSSPQPPVPSPQFTVPGPRSAWRDGWKRVLAAPALVAGVFALTFLLALPLVITLRGLLAAHLGGSLAAETAASGINYDWWQEFTAQATGLGTTFTPSVIGFATVLDNIGGVLDARARIAPLATALALYLVGWAFLSGGILDRYARQRPIRVHGFFAASGAYGVRFVRLAVIAGLIYWWLFAYVHPWLFDTQFDNLTRGMNTERAAFLVRAIFYVFFGGVLLAVNLVVDYTKVRIVVEDRRSALGAIAAAVRFIRAHLRQVLALYALNSLTFLVLIAVWALIAPGVGDAGLSMWAGFVVAQLYIVARLLLKVQFVASQIALFQANLAHASYVSAPIPVWPDSPAAEAIDSSPRSA
jgi:hypothetical protein